MLCYPLVCLYSEIKSDCFCQLWIQLLSQHHKIKCALKSCSPCTGCIFVSVVLPKNQCHFPCDMTFLSDYDTWVYCSGLTFAWGWVPLIRIFQSQIWTADSLICWAQHVCNNFQNASVLRFIAVKLGFNRESVCSKTFLYHYYLNEWDLADDLIERSSRWVHCFRRKTDYLAAESKVRQCSPFFTCFRKEVNTEESQPWKGNIKTLLTLVIMNNSFSFHSPCIHLLPLSVHADRWLFDAILGGSYTLTLFILTLLFVVMVVWQPHRSSMRSMV